jgi:hypothetical protein
MHIGGSSEGHASLRRRLWRLTRRDSASLDLTGNGFQTWDKQQQWSDLASHQCASNACEPAKPPHNTDEGE